jgi:hypothetical protein
MNLIKKLIYLITALHLLLAVPAAAQQRFSKPEFESGYEQPDTITPEPRSLGLEYFDVAVLLAVLSLASWLALKKRSRQGILWLSICINGCTCSIP